jgi:hypothetical protein
MLKGRSDYGQGSAMSPMLGIVGQALCRPFVKLSSDFFLDNHPSGRSWFMWLAQDGFNQLSQG